MTTRAAFLDAPRLAPGVTRMWMIRHALVEENARLSLYGSLDVPLCPDTLRTQVPMYQALAARLPSPARWIVTPLSRTQHTARAIQDAGYPRTDWEVEPALVEQSMGDFHGVRHADLPAKLRQPAHPFWPISAAEVPPGGESMEQVCARVSGAMERIADDNDGRDVVVVSHGGAIRAAAAHALGIGADAALRLSMQNLSLSVLERHGSQWRVVTLNELPGF
ncbi:MAG: histidine phosphatase family protein [Gluconacetobacter diazotrophicus]|nr:histidine phosphatase family protein [Gluconacetobacter diazotrophicus]